MKTYTVGCAKVDGSFTPYNRYWLGTIVADTLADAISVSRDRFASELAQEAWDIVWVFDNDTGNSLIEVLKKARKVE